MPFSSLSNSSSDALRTFVLSLAISLISFQGVPPGGLPARDDCLKKDRFLGLNIRDQIGVTLNVNYQNPLSCVLLLIRMVIGPKGLPFLDPSLNLLKRDTTLYLELLVLRLIPPDLFHEGML